EEKAVKVQDYANVIWRRGVAEGVGEPLPPEQVARRYTTFRLHRRGGRALRLDVIDGKGRLTNRNILVADLVRAPATEPQRKECSYLFKRDAEGKLTEQVSRDAMGRLVATLHFTSPTTAYYTDDRGFPAAQAGSGAA